MQPRIESGQLCTVEPIADPATIARGDVVLCKVRGAEYLHLVTAAGSDGRFQISNNKGHVNGWVASTAIFGRCMKVEP